MDLENECYLVRFQDEDDYNRALIRGPWVVFGCYLFVRSLSLDFSVNQIEVDS